MKYELRYLGQSRVDHGPYRSTIAFSPNLGRERVSFGGELADPIRFREAISALHEVVVGDLRFKKRDKTAYTTWQAAKTAEENELRATMLDGARKKAIEAIAKEPTPPGLWLDFQRLHRKYWNARVRWANELSRDDPELFRHLVPCDPVITVANDVVFFEAFSKDESSYGCLYVDRGSFVGAQDAQLGTTNVDYSLALYEHFQTLRTYRTTRLELDAHGFDVKVEGRADYREEKIELPPSWLRGFGQISAATGVKSRTIVLDVATVYSLLAFLRRHREKAGPRSIRVELVRGKAPRLVLEPWEQVIESRGPTWAGEADETFKLWGRRRLLVLSRVLPLADRIELRILGSGLPSIWVVHMGDMRFVLALSGWTTNDWSSGTNLDLLTGAVTVAAGTLEGTFEALHDARTATSAAIAGRLGASASEVAPALHRLARVGQVVYDHTTQAYRFRQVIERPMAETLIGPEPVELTEARKLFVDKRVQTSRDEPVEGKKRLLVAKVAGESVEALMDADRVFTRAKCTCTHHRRFGLRNGACRHLLAVRLTVLGADRPKSSFGGGFFS